MQKRYAELEKFLYTNPDEEVSFLAGAFHTVSTTAVMALAGPIPAIAYGVLTDKYFSKPFREEKNIRHANLKGFAAGLATYLMVASAIPAETPVLSFGIDKGEIDTQELSMGKESANAPVPHTI